MSLDPKQQQTLLHSSDLELGETVRLAIEEIERLKPKRIVFDSLSEIRLLSMSALRYRRQVLALKHFFLLHDATVLMLDDLTSDRTTLICTAFATASSVSRRQPGFTDPSGAAFAS